MILLFFLTILLRQTLATNEECPGQIATTVEKEVLQANFNMPREFALDKGLNTLYFTHGLDYQLGKLNLETKKYKDVEAFHSNSQTVNQDTHELYMSLKDGILKYDARRFVTEFVEELYSERRVNYVYFNNNLYYTEGLSGLVYKVTDSGDVMVPLGNAKVERFVIDGNGTYFYINGSHLYSLGKNNVLVEYEGDKHKALTTDNNGKIIVCNDHGIFHVNKEKRALENVVTQTTSGCSGVAVDRDNNIVFSDGDAVIRLKPQTKCIQID